MQRYLRALPMFGGIGLACGSYWQLTDSFGRLARRRARHGACHCRSCQSGERREGVKGQRRPFSKQGEQCNEWEKKKEES